MLQITCNPARMLAAIKAVSGALSKDITRHNVHGIHVKPTGPYGVRLCATDGHALVYLDVEVESWRRENDGLNRDGRILEIEAVSTTLRSAKKAPSHVLEVSADVDGWPEYQRVTPPRTDAGDGLSCISLDPALVARVCAPLRGAKNVRWQFTDATSPVRIDFELDCGNGVAVIMPRRM